MTMRILRRSEQRVVPWRNGRGQTIEIAVYPPDSTITDFEWRISSAAVDTDGPFSIFPGIDRTLVLLDGEGLTLVGAEGVLDRRYAMCSFAGEAPVNGALHGGPVTDLNVMTRRDRWTHSVVVAQGRLSASLYVALEPSSVVTPDTTLALSPGDALVADGVVQFRGMVAAITLTPAG